MYKGQKQLLLVFIIISLFLRRFLVAKEFICYHMMNICRNIEENLVIDSHPLGWYRISGGLKSLQNIVESDLIHL
jgi:hypothetical protein